MHLLYLCRSVHFTLNINQSTYGLQSVVTSSNVKRGEALQDRHTTVMSTRQQAIQQSADISVRKSVVCAVAHKSRHDVVFVGVHSIVKRRAPLIRASNRG